MVMSAPEANPGPSPQRALTKAGLAEELLLGIALLLSVIGTSFKLIAWLKGSMAALVDAATCFASIVAGLVSIWAYLKAREPPDIDHSYGHERYLLYGSVVIAVVYSVVLGMVLDRLLQRLVNPYYTIELTAPLYTFIGTVFYAIAVFLASKAGFIGRTYAVFISSEILEGIVTIGSVAGGVLLSNLIDYIGGWVLIAYLAFEIVHELNKYKHVLTDWAEPYMLSLIKRMFSEKGVEVKNIRLRMIMPDKYHGDAIVVVPEDYNIDKAHAIVDEIVKEVKDRLGVDLIVHYEPKARKKPDFKNLDEQDTH